MERLKNAIQALIRAVQKVLLFVFLTLLYWIGFALTWLFLVVVDRGFLWGKADDGGWVDATGYDLDGSAHPS